jgi:hypothetical protein
LDGGAGDITTLSRRQNDRQYSRVVVSCLLDVEETNCGRTCQIGNRFNDCGIQAGQSCLDSRFSDFTGAQPSHHGQTRRGLLNRNTQQLRWSAPCHAL